MKTADTFGNEKKRLMSSRIGKDLSNQNFFYEKKLKIRKKAMICNISFKTGTHTSHTAIRYFKKSEINNKWIYWFLIFMNIYLNIYYIIYINGESFNCFFYFHFGPRKFYSFSNYGLLKLVSSKKSILECLIIYYFFVENTKMIIDRWYCPEILAYK